jgi:hypothetical protein
MTLPAFDVIIWLRSPSTLPGLFERIVEKANMAPYESTVFEGFRDIHWGFSNAAEAIEFAALDDVTKLTALGESVGGKVYNETVSLSAPSAFRPESQVMSAKVNLTDKEALYRALDGR